MIFVGVIYYGKEFAKLWLQNESFMYKTQSHLTNHILLGNKYLQT